MDSQKTSFILKSIFSVLLLLIVSKSIFSQNQQSDTLKLQAIVYNGDTIPMSILENIYVYAHLTEEQKKAVAKYNRLRNAVYVTYPYARKSGIVLNDINANIVKYNKESDRKRYIKSREKELKKEFTTPLTKLSVYQGKILMKLINRETGNNCYEIIKEYRGGLTARLYQTVAFFFDSNLKQPYYAEKEDWVIEKIVKEVQRLYGYDEIAKKK
jgi:hypothetical protein